MGTFRFADLVRMGKNERIHPAASDWNFQFSNTVILSFCFPEGCALFGFLLNPVENLLLTIGVNSGMLPSLSWRLQSMREFQLHKISWAGECSCKRINRNRNVVFPFSDITNINNLLASELELLESRDFADDLAQTSWDAKLG
jgi:hypothetical protein